MTLGLFTLHAFIDRHDVMWSVGDLENEANPLLRREHYLGPLTAGGCELVVMGSRSGDPVACQVWRLPTSRRLPSDGSWLELSRWCLTPGAGDYAGSRQHRYAVRLIRELLPGVSTLVSYSDPSQGHTGALYRACNWYWSPTWHRLRPPPSGQGAWTPLERQEVKDRWVFDLAPDARRSEVLRIDDLAAIRHWRASAGQDQLRWATHHPQLGGAA